MEIDDFDKRVIRDTIEHLYTVQKVVPTIKKLMPVLREKINWRWGPTSLRKMLKSMGFVWKKAQNKRVLLLERADIVHWRSRFLVQIKHMREDGKEVFYLDESWIDNNLTSGKCWQKEKDVLGVTAWGSSSKRLIIASVGSRKGFIKEAQLIFPARSTQGDYHGQMNSINFEKWFSTSVLPNLPPASIVVMDNAPYHSRQEEKTPSKYGTKATMIQWLERRGISCDGGMRKDTLYSLIQANKPPHKLYAVDAMATAKGHTVVRLPPYNCDLNAIELAWAKIKRIFREHNVTGDMSAANLHKHTVDAFSSVTSEDWEGYCKKVQEVEQEYWRQDGVMETAVDEIIITGNAIVDTSEESDSSSSSEDSQSDSSNE